MYYKEYLENPPRNLNFYIAHWYRILIFVNKVFFSFFWADFNAQYGKLEGFLGPEIHFFKKISTFNFQKILKFMKEIPKYDFLFYFEKLTFFFKKLAVDNYENQCQ